MVTAVSTLFFIITQVSREIKGIGDVLIFSKCKYLHVKTVSLATVKSCVTVGPIP